VYVVVAVTAIAVDPLLSESEYDPTHISTANL
jgi:hypothetical protein